MYKKNHYGKIYDNVRKNFFDNNVIKKGDVIIVALSGGMDSMCLFDVMVKLAQTYDFILKAIHIHHGIRGDEADRDMKFVEGYCESQNVKLIKVSVDAINYSKKNGLTLEEGARILRYKAFNDIYNEYKDKCNSNEVFVTVAHHQNDLAETVIHNIIRGTGLKGLVGIKQINNYILRPLLYVEKNDIEKYVKVYQVPYVTDSTNDDIKYTRNYIRKEIIDRFKTLNDKAISHIVDLSLNINEVNDYIESIAKETYTNCVDKTAENKKLIVDLNKLVNVPHIIKTEVIRLVIADVVKTLKDITKIHIDAVIKLIESDKGGHLDLPYNIVVDKKKKKLAISVSDENISMKNKRKKYERNTEL